MADFEANARWHLLHYLVKRMLKKSQRLLKVLDKSKHA
jgi:hypothetical protein